MSLKKRLFRAGCVTLVLLGLVGYFGFSTLLFPPFEGRFKAGVAGLVPRAVDLYVGRVGLEELFSEFPHLRALEELKGNPGFEAFADSPEWTDFARANGVQDGLAQLEAALAQIPLGLEPLGIFGGKEVALAGTFAGKGWNKTDWAVYGRASRVGKLLVAALRYPGLLKLDRQGIQVARDGDVFTLSGSSFPRPIAVTRINDVIVAGPGAELVRQARTLADTGSQDSLLLAAPYGEHILGLESRDPRKRDFEVVLDVKALREKWGMTKPWPDPAAQRFLPAFLGRLLQLGSVNRVFGVLEFDSGVSADLRGDFSSELISDEQARIYRSRSFDHGAIDAIARAAHEDTTFLAYLHGPVGTLLEMVVASMEPALRQNLEEALKSTNRYKTLAQLISDLDAGMHDRVALIARPNDWGYEKDWQRDPNTNEVLHDAAGDPIYIGPPFTPDAVFAWTLVVWHENEQKLIDLREHVGQSGEKYGLRGRNPGERGYYMFQIAGNFATREFWSPFVPGTGHIATVNLPEHMMVTNRYMMLEDLTQNLLQRTSRTGRLTDRVDFATLLDEMPPAGNLFIWSNPATGIDVLREQADRLTRGKVESSIDLVQKRRELEPLVRRDNFGGKARNQLTADEVARLDQELDVRVAEYRDQAVQANLPGALEEVERNLTYLKSISAFMALIDLEEKSFRVAVRAVTPYGAK